MRSATMHSPTTTPWGWWRGCAPVRSPRPRSSTRLSPGRNGCSRSSTPCATRRSTGHAPRRGIRTRATSPECRRSSRTTSTSPGCPRSRALGPGWRSRQSWTATWPGCCSTPVWWRSGRPSSRSSGSTPVRSSRTTSRCATRGTPITPRAPRRPARLRSWRPASYPSLTPTTAAARSGSRPRAVGWSGSSRPGAGRRTRSGRATCRCGSCPTAS